MKINTKIPNKILLIANEMFIRKIIQHNQLGFMPDLQGWFCIFNLITFINHIIGLRQKLHHHFNIYKIVFDKICHFQLYLLTLYSQ